MQADEVEEGEQGEGGGDRGRGHVSWTAARSMIQQQRRQ
jgi:hypothetical protein